MSVVNLKVGFFGQYCLYIVKVARGKCSKEVWLVCG